MLNAQLVNEESEIALSLEWINLESNHEVHLRRLMCKEPIKWRWVYLANEQVKEPKLNQNSTL